MFEEEEEGEEAEAEEEEKVVGERAKGWCSGGRVVVARRRRGCCCVGWGGGVEGMVRRRVGNGRGDNEGLCVWRGCIDVATSKALGKERGELLNMHVPTLAPLRWSQSSPAQA